MFDEICHIPGTELPETRNDAGWENFVLHWNCHFPPLYSQTEEDDGYPQRRIVPEDIFTSRSGILSWSFSTITLAINNL